MPIRPGAALLSAALAVAVVAAGTGSAHGESPAPVAGVTGIPAPTTTTARVTLITGDQVTVTSQAGKTVSVDVIPYNRPAGDIRTFTVGTDVYVMPKEAELLVGSGQVDRRLFNVTQLIAQGYDDAHSESIPMIVRYPENAAKKAGEPSAPDGARITRSLPGVRGAAVTADKKQGDTFWEAVDDDTSRAGTPKARLSGGIQRLWLDGKVKALLDKSVPQIGAPEAWAAGYDGTGVKVAVLDTGVDPTHPDLAGRIADSRSFVPDEAVAGRPRPRHARRLHDRRHRRGVRRQAQGRRARRRPARRQGARRRRLRPGLRGSSPAWSGPPHSGAKVVSMSLGGGGADGTDPMSQAVNELTAETGTLFVIAAGNAGPGATTSARPAPPTRR